MPTEIANNVEDGIHVVGVQNDPEKDYLLWQRAKAEKSIHFEWNGQANSGYDIVKECSLDRDGIHIVLSNNKLVHFYFQKCSKEDWEILVDGLRNIYSNDSSILEIYR